MAIVRVGDDTIAVVETRRRSKPFYVGKLAFGRVPDDASDACFFQHLDNAKAELAQLERAARS